MTASDHGIVSCSGVLTKVKIRKCASFSNPIYYLIRLISDGN